MAGEKIEKMAISFVKKTDLTARWPKLCLLLRGTELCVSTLLTDKEAREGHHGIPDIQKALSALFGVMVWENQRDSAMRLTEVFGIHQLIQETQGVADVPQA